jgi:mannosyltransferase
MLHHRIIGIIMMQKFNTAMTQFLINRYSPLVAIAAITLLAAALRFYKLGQWSFWGDEYITVRNAMDVFGGGFLRLTPSLLGTYISFSLFGVNEWSARLVAASAGVISIPVLYGLIKRQYNSQLALVTSLLLAVSSWHIYWSQNARFYTLLLLFYTLALFYFYWAIEEDRPLLMFLSLVFFGLAAFERLIAAFFIPIVGTYMISLKIGWFGIPRGLRWRNLSVYVLPGILFVVFLIITNPALTSVDTLFVRFGFVNNNPLWLLSGVGFYIGIPLLIMATAGAVILLTRLSRFGLLLTLGFIVPLVSIVIISLFSYSANRYIFPALTSVIILAAFAIYELWRQMQGSGKLLAFGVILIMFIMPMTDNMLYFFYQNGNRDNWKAALEFVASEMEAEDRIAIVDVPLAEYYLKRRAIDMHYLEKEGLSMVTSNNASTWFIIDLTAPEKTPDVTKWIKENALYIRNFDVVVSARRYPMAVYKYTSQRP